MLTDRFDDALAYASRLHRDQRRKGTEIPYVSHLLGVASLALEFGADEDQAIAALLHDAVEDQGGLDQLEAIRARFGERVAEIVAHCTDSHEEPKPEWRTRKEAYIAGLAHKPAESLLVSLADKTHNAGAILADLAIHGNALWGRFTGGREGTLWYYNALAAAFVEHLPGPAAHRLKGVVEDMHRIAPNSNASEEEDEDEDDVLLQEWEPEALYDEAKRLVVAHRKASPAWLQRQLGVGYSVANAAMERMEADGIVSTSDAHGKRVVLAERTALVLAPKAVTAAQFEGEY